MTNHVSLLKRKWDANEEVKLASDRALHEQLNRVFDISRLYLFLELLSRLAVHCIKLLL